MNFKYWLKKYVAAIIFLLISFGCWLTSCIFFSTLSNYVSLSGLRLAPTLSAFMGFLTIYFGHLYFLSFYDKTDFIEKYSIEFNNEMKR